VRVCDTLIFTPPPEIVEIVNATLGASDIDAIDKCNRQHKSAICNFRAQLQILGGGGLLTPLTRPSRVPAPPLHQTILKTWTIAVIGWLGQQPLEAADGGIGSYGGVGGYRDPCHMCIADCDLEADTAHISVDTVADTFCHVSSYPFAFVIGLHRKYSRPHVCRSVGYDEEGLINALRIYSLRGVQVVLA